MSSNRIDVLNELELYRDALKTGNKEIASVIKKRIVHYVCDLETENQRLNSESDPEAFLAVHMSATADSNEVIRQLKAKLEESRKNEAVCHCGALFSEHTQSDNHGAVGMEHPCPNEEKLRELGVHLSHCNFGEHAGTCKYGEENTCPALSEQWRWMGNAISRRSKLEAENERFKEVLKQVKDELVEIAYKCGVNSFLGGDPVFEAVRRRTAKAAKIIDNAQNDKGVE